jgi:hypothetical protein
MHLHYLKYKPRQIQISTYYDVEEYSYFSISQFNHKNQIRKIVVKSRPHSNLKDKSKTYTEIVNLYPHL